MSLDEPVVRRLVVARPLILHSVFFGEALDLAVTEHRQAGQGRHQRRYAEALVALAELVNCRAFIRIAHEVHVTLHDVGIEFERVLDDRAVLGVLFVAHHVHERAVVDAMHAKRANEVSLHEPEGFGEQQCSGHFCGDPINHLAPEFVRHVLIELGLAHAVFRTRWNGSARTRAGKPESMEVALGERHCSIEPDDGKQPRHIQNGLDYLLAHRWIEVVELSSVIPGKAGAVVAVVDVARVAGMLVAAAKHHCRIGLLEVMVFNLDLDASVVRKIGPIEAVGRIGRTPGAK